MFYPLVSVIIPVYQAEKFLTECVESVRKQDYSELEIVLVNDGSTDRSNQMCEELAAADPRIRVIHQNNKGSGAARNAGIKEATGKYLLSSWMQTTSWTIHLPYVPLPHGQKESRQIL